MQGATVARSSGFALPDIPTLKEEDADNGLQGYMAVYAAANTPPAAIEKLNAAAIINFDLKFIF